MKMDINNTYWEENTNIHHLKYENCNSNNDEHPRLKDEPLYRCCDSNLNFATVACSEDDSEYNQYKKSKVSRQDPMSHRIIEKRRRDRMNNCLADLSRLIPAEYLKKGRGRIEKTEIIEMAIRHIKFLQQSHRANPGNRTENVDRSQSHEQYRLGYQECMSETMRFLVEVEGYFPREALCVRLINHLQKHCDNLLLRDRINSTAKHIEKDFQQSTSIQGLVSPVSVMSSTSVRPQTPLRTISESFENGSQLRDMLTANVKDEIRITDSPIIIKPASPIREEINMNARLPTPEREKPNAEVDKQIAIERNRKISENENYTNGASLYKFKNNIKQRFSQDLNAESNQTNNKQFKRRKYTDSTRRNSVTTETYSSENHSSPIDGSQCSPPCSELYRISSESENNRISPTGSSVSDIRNSNRYLHLKADNSIQKNGFDRFSPIPKHNFNVKNNMTVSQNNDLEKTNFGVPIFALHAKGSFYIPLTIDYNTLVPYLQNQNILDILPNVHNIILHPVTINVNFQSNYFNGNNTTVIKSKQKHEGQNGWH